MFSLCFCLMFSCSPMFVLATLCSAAIIQGAPFLSQPAKRDSTLGFDTAHVVMMAPSWGLDMGVVNRYHGDFLPA